MSKKKTHKHARQHKKQLSRQQIEIQQSRFYSGPLPEASDLAKYEEISPGTAKTIIENFEKQSAHRRDVEKSVITSDAKNSRRGLVCAFIIGLVGMSSGTFLAYKNMMPASCTFFSGTLGSLAGVFVAGAHTRRKEKELEFGTRK